jgi:hypothetical protein
MTDVFTDPSFAGLHWSIPPDTPDENRALAHLSAACAARAKRDREEDRPVELAYDPREDRRLLGWPNGSLTWMSSLEMAAQNLRTKEPR